MAYEYETTGTINVTNGSKTVTGNGTNWVTNYPGVVINLNGPEYVVASVDSANSLTLVHPYPGETATGLPYTFVPTQPDNYGLVSKLNDYVDYATTIIDAKTGPQGKTGPAGPSGPAGQNGDSGFGAIVNLSETAGQLAGQKGIYLIAPVIEGNPGITLSQQSQVIIPFGTKNPGIGLWINATTSGYAITLGLANVPLPQPEMPTTPVDLSGSGTIYGTPGTKFPLGIFLAGSQGPFTVDVPFNLPIEIERKVPVVTPVASRWDTGGTGSPYPVTGDAVGSDMVMNKFGGGVFGYENNHLVLNKDTFIYTGPLALDFASLGDDTLTQTPPWIKISFKGKVASDIALFGNLMDYNVGQFGFGPSWQGSVLKATISRNGGNEDVFSDETPLRKLGTSQLYECEWINNPTGLGGLVRFYIDGVKIGADKATEVKMRVSPGARFECNASLGNTAVSVDGMEIEYVSLSYGKPGFQSEFERVQDGPIAAVDLERLVVDARLVPAGSDQHHVTYSSNGQVQDLTVIVGEMVVPSGLAYKAVLEDWSSGVGVAHPNELVMTKPLAQNCKFEDVALFGKQASWTEVGPQGTVPSIGGIDYHCNGIRMGNYVQFQFGYDWNSATMPANPFGDPTNKVSYMVPHKWLIYDKDGTLLRRIEKPNGQPLNGTDTKPHWEGTYDGRGVAIITEANPFYPHGTVRSSVIYRSSDPLPYDQADIWSMVPTFDHAVPFASQVGYSVNGFDMRIYAGTASGDGQSNGFGNYRTMSWKPTTYQGIIQQAKQSLNPWKQGTSETAVTPNAGLWRKYTPFNQTGRSPTTGPGGTRDDRQIMPEMVGRYARDVNGTHPMDGRPMRETALDYLTGYASDPYHAFENGACVPLYKGSARRNITLRNHYYGGGEQSVPESQAYYIQGGRLYEWVAGGSPLRVNAPAKGYDSKHAIFGGNQIDDAHAHQFPHWGSLLFQSPEFAFLGHKFFDQARLYNNQIIMSQYGPEEIGYRGAAWKFMHAALAWKTASANSPRLYSRAEIMDWLVFDFEAYYDRWYAGEGGILNPPSNISDGQGGIDYIKSLVAAISLFGPSYNRDNNIHCADFQAGYWVSALHAAEKMGFNNAIRAASPKAEAIINWMLTMYQKRAEGRLLDNYLVPPFEDTEYQAFYWSRQDIVAANFEVSNLPRTFAEIQARWPADKLNPTWDTARLSNGAIVTRDGQAMDQLLAGPALLKDIGRTGSRLDEAFNVAAQRTAEKVASETAKGANDAGFSWFVYNQITNNPPHKR